ncbi:MAG: family 65 glycosyl hydrolase domain-containing protein [Christensenellales bacterium]
MKTIFAYDPWRLVENELHKDDMRLSESMTSIGNGHMGMRGNFEERYSGDSHRGTYLAGVWFPDKTRVGWWKNGYPQYFGKVINAMNIISLRVRIDREDIDLFEDDVLSFQRVLDMRAGVLSREFVIRREKGTVRVFFERFVSIARPELLACVPRDGGLRLQGRAHSRHRRGRAQRRFQLRRNLRLFEGEDEDRDGVLSVRTRTRENPFGTPRFSVCGAMAAEPTETLKKHRVAVEEGHVARKFVFEAEAGQTVGCDKFVCVATDRDHREDELTQAATAGVLSAQQAGYDALRREQERAWARRWEKADVRIDGDVAGQQGIRFNIFQLFSTYYGEDARLNIGPKGFTGEKYGGATYWDTEAYCLPMYTAIAGEEVAQNLLKYRWLQIDGAYHNAREQGLPGALYPMVTFTGIECHNEWEITFEEIHRNNAIAYAIYAYTQYTGDRSYLDQYGIDVLLGIARFWAGRVHYCKRTGQYMIHGVTGPNEYENNVNNNWYTNRLAAWELAYTAEQLMLIPREKAQTLSVNAEEIRRFREISEKMYLPYDKEIEVFVQHDTFLDKDLMPASALSPEDRPLNQKWSWDRILRSCFIKQADVLQGLYFLEHLYDKETIRRNFDFYEPMTVHESSLSPCVHSILAASLGKLDKAQELYRRTARLDLDNINNDTCDGLHITSMAGSWLSIVQGFAGMRTITGKLSFDPQLPDGWDGYAFKVVYRGRLIEVSVSREGTGLKLLSGEALTVTLHGREVTLSTAEADA